METLKLKRSTDLAYVAAIRAGRLLSSYFNSLSTLRVTTKSSNVDLVSEADQRSEDLLRLELSAALPEAGFIGEESADGSDGLQDYNWVVDPLDGTSNFLSGLPIWAVSVALCDRDLRPLLGVVHAPELGRTWLAARGQGAYLNGNQIKIRPLPPGGGLENAMLATGFPYDMDSRPGQSNLRYFCHLQRQYHKIRRLGSAALDLAFIAAGVFDGMWELMLHSWDTAAGVCLVEEAGGLISRFDGSPYLPGDPDLLAAATPELLAELQAHLAEANAKADC